MSMEVEEEEEEEEPHLEAALCSAGAGIRK